MIGCSIFIILISCQPLFYFEDVMKKLVPLNGIEMSTLIRWRSEILNWPDDIRILNKIKEAHANDSDLYLTPFQIGLVRGWCEQELSGHYGGGVVVNMEEHSILKKINSLGER